MREALVVVNPYIEICLSLSLTLPFLLLSGNVPQSGIAALSDWTVLILSIYRGAYSLSICEVWIKKGLFSGVNLFCIKIIVPTLFSSIDLARRSTGQETSSRIQKVTSSNMIENLYLSYKKKPTIPSFSFSGRVMYFSNLSLLLFMSHMTSVYALSILF